MALATNNETETLPAATQLYNLV